MRLERSASRRRSPTTWCVYQRIDPSNRAMSAARRSSGLPRRMRSTDPVGPHVRSERFGNGHGAVFMLMMLENAGDGARQRQPRTVQRMKKARLVALRGAKANVGAACLEVREVAARRYLQPGADPRRPSFEI